MNVWASVQCLFVLMWWVCVWAADSTAACWEGDSQMEERCCLSSHMVPYWCTGSKVNSPVQSIYYECFVSIQSCMEYLISQNAPKLYFFYIYFTLSKVIMKINEMNNLMRLLHKKTNRSFTGSGKIYIFTTHTIYHTHTRNADWNFEVLRSNIK